MELGGKLNQEFREDIKVYGKAFTELQTIDDEFRRSMSQSITYVETTQDININIPVSEPNIYHLYLYANIGSIEWVKHIQANMNGFTKLERVYKTNDEIRIKAHTISEISYHDISNIDLSLL